jgi:hypothetical protein
MRRMLAVGGGLVLLVVTGAAPIVSANPGSGVSPEVEGQPVFFAAEVFATPSYHLMEIPKVEEGGEGFAWANVNQTPESWGRSLAFWPGPTGETLFRSSVPQNGPLAGHEWRAPGAWTSYPPGGDSPGDADFGEPATLPLGPTVDTPGGKFRVLSFSAHATEEEGVGDFAFGSFQGAAAPVSIGFARSFAEARRVEGAAVSSGWAVARDLRLGDVSIDEVRSEASVRATPAGEESTWKLTIFGLALAGQRLEWTDAGVSFAPGSEQAIDQLNQELGRGAESVRSEFRIVPGRIWEDDDGAHAQAGFLQLGHRPAPLENNPGQKLSYSLSVVSARALYRLEAPDVVDDLPVAPPDVARPPVAIGEGATLERAPAPGVRVEGSSGGFLFNDPGRGGDSSSDVALPLDSEPEAVPATSETASALGALGTGPGAAAVPIAGLGPDAARSLRGGIGLLALGGLGAAAAVLGAARRQLALTAATQGRR